MTSTPTIDLNAAKRESKHPEGITVTLGTETFTLPSELPADVFDPLLSDDLDLVGVVKEVLDEKDTSGGDDADEGFGEKVLDLLLNRPSLPRQAVQAVKDCFAVLFGDEQYERFLTQRPSFNDYLRLGKGLSEFYGVGLGEAFASPGSSESGGETQKQTSPSTTESTPETPGAAQETPASSA